MQGLVQWWDPKNNAKPDFIQVDLYTKPYAASNRAFMPCNHHISCKTITNKQF